ncbi:hypothetical protein [Bacillus sp. 1P06AnD]|uniref:hypothetical protein n=1 Tax=Bacillus sp. 1P06AnD TaxID=3132208 RepID=UPI0039A0D35F
MSDYQQYVGEKLEIDSLMKKGYRIRSVNETLDGAFLTFYHDVEKQNELIRVMTANGRKYFSTFLLDRSVP